MLGQPPLPHSQKGQQVAGEAQQRPHRLCDWVVRKVLGGLGSPSGAMGNTWGVCVVVLGPRFVKSRGLANF